MFYNLATQKDPWDDHDGDERVLDNHMKKLRQALGAARGQIKTVIKGGYKIVE